MASHPPPSELTLRDVLAQIDRRLTRIEDDQRDTQAVLRTKADAEQVDRQFGQVRGEIHQVRQGMSWILGLLLTSWLSLMGAVLLKP